jgi:hypothetical protein
VVTVKAAEEMKEEIRITKKEEGIQMTALIFSLIPKKILKQLMNPRPTKKQTLNLLRN